MFTICATAMGFALLSGGALGAVGGAAIVVGLGMRALGVQFP